MSYISHQNVIQTIVTISLFFAIALTGTGLLASSQIQRGQAIMEEAIQRDDGYGDMKMEVKMVLKNSQGEKSTRFLKIRQLEIKNDGDKLLTTFEKPRDVQGTSLLTFTHVEKDDDQWLFLPAIKRVKRISSSNKSGSFMGSEFAFEDLASEELQKYKSYKLLREEIFGDHECFVVERVPTDNNSGYTRQVVWIDSTEYRFMRIDYYDRRDALLKTRTFHDYRKYINKYWRSSEIEMKNHQSGKETTLFVSNIQFQVGMNDGDFDQAALRRVR